MAKKPICLMSTVCFGDKSLAKEEVIKELRQRQKIIQDNGLDFKTLLPVRKLWKGDTTLGPELEKIIPESIVTLSDESYTDGRDYINSLCWPRDLFQVFGENAYSLKKEQSSVSGLLKQMELNMSIRNSPLGEGGLNVRLGKKLILSNIFTLSQYEKDKREIISKGFDTYFAPVLLRENDAMDSIEKALAKRMSINGHIDTEMGLAKTPNGNYILLVSNEYQKTFEDTTREIAKKLNAKIYITEGEQMAANLINLPNGKIILPEKYRSTVDFLKENMGYRNVIPIKTFPGETTNSGDLRCRTNIIE